MGIRKVYERTVLLFVNGNSSSGWFCVLTKVCNVTSLIVDEKKVKDQDEFFTKTKKKFYIPEHFFFVKNMHDEPLTSKFHVIFRGHRPWE